MAEDVKTESSDKRLNDLVAITVVLLSVFMAVSNIKDDNVVQAMLNVQAEAVDAWAEYQAARLKLHVDENGLLHLRLLETAGGVDRGLSATQAADYESDLAKYEGRSAETMAKAKAMEAEYRRLGFRDDQFDISEAFLSIGVAVAAVATLVERYIVLYIAWGSGTLGITFGAAGFAGWNLRPEWLAQLIA